MTLINHKYKFVFLKPSRVGGSSIQYALLRDFGPAIIGMTGDPWIPSELKGLKYFTSRLHSHATYNEILEIFPEVKNYTLLSIKRHPYARFVSAINFFGHFRKYPLSKFNEDIFERAYDEAIEALKHDDYLLKLGNRINFLNYETLFEDYKNFCIKYGVKPKALPKLKASKFSLILPDEYYTKIQKEVSDEFDFHRWQR